LATISCFPAELAQSILDDAGIESVVIDDNMGRMLGWNVGGGFKLQVNKENAEVALRLLSAPKPRSVE
jgi:predicted permease